MKERMEGAPKYLEERDPHNTTTERSPEYQNGMVHHNITQSEMVRRCPKYYMIKKRQREIFQDVTFDQIVERRE